MARKKHMMVKTLYGSFPCVFEQERDMGGYSVEASGVQGGISWGKTFAQAKVKIRESIEGAIETRAIVQAERRGSIRIMRRSLSGAVA